MRVLGYWWGGGVLKHSGPRSKPLSLIHAWVRLMLSDRWLVKLSRRALEASTRFPGPGLNTNTQTHRCTHKTCTETRRQRCRRMQRQRRRHRHKQTNGQRITEREGERERERERGRHGQRRRDVPKGTTCKNNHAAFTRFKIRMRKSRHSAPET